MIFQYTGQPGHGKTVLALEHLLRFKAQGREVYACNVRKLDYAKAGIKEFTPDEFKDWPNQLPTGAVLLVDECYEHEMLSKRRPGSTVPEHVKQLAKHRHLGYDFIFVAQSPTKQMDEFVHDLIEEHYHVRRRYGLPFVHVRRFDRYEKSPEKATPLTTQRKRYPKHIFQLYESTQMDTAERRVPWFYYAAAALVVFVLGFGWWTLGSVEEKFTEPTTGERGDARAANERTEGTVGSGLMQKAVATPEEWLTARLPRFPGMHGSQPLFDDRAVLTTPRTYCVMSGGDDGMERCRCYTEQVTRLYDVPDRLCRYQALYGVYDPHRLPYEPPVSTTAVQPTDGPKMAPAAPAGTGSDPAAVGTPRQGAVWGRLPDTLRASGE